MKLNVDVKGNPLPCELYMDGYLKQNLDFLYNLVRKNWDGIDVVWGYEGDGKSVYAMQKALYMDADFNLDNIVFTPEQFNDAVDKAKQFTSIVWDEADILSGKWWDQILMSLKSKFKRIRSKNLFITLVTPTIFDMDKYFIVHRTRFGTEVYSKGDVRGYFRFFNLEKKKILYLRGKRDWNTKVVKPNFIARFTNLPKDFPINMDDYNDKKDEATQQLMKMQKINKQQHLSNYRKKCLVRMTKQMRTAGIKLTQNEYADIFGVARSSISADLSDSKI